MADDEKLTLADPKDIAQSISFALRFGLGTARLAQPRIYPIKAL